MQMKSKITMENVARYVNEKITTDSKIEGALRKETSVLPQAGMISSPDVGALLALLAQTANTKNAIEVGTFTGYTALKVAQILPTGGKLVCCDISTEWTDIGKKYWEQAKVTDKIDLRIAPAMDTLNSLLKSGGKNKYDFAFIDADKTGYDSYYEVCLELIRPGGVIVLDNMLRDGDVVDMSVQDASTVAIRKMNEKISRDSRVDSCLMTVGDGLMMVRKK